MQIESNTMGLNIDSEKKQRGKVSEVADNSGIKTEYELTADNADVLLREKNIKRQKLIQKVQQLLDNIVENGNSSHAALQTARLGLSYDGEQLMTKKIEGMSYVDSNLFAYNIFSNIYKICFGDINSQEDVSSHIMSRVLGGETINAELEGKRKFYFDERDVTAEELLDEFIRVGSYEELIDKYARIKTLAEKIRKLGLTL